MESFPIDGIQITNLTVIIIIYLAALGVFYFKKGRKRVNAEKITATDMVNVFFQVIFLLGGINVIYYAFTKTTLFESMPLSTDVLIALSGILMLYLGIKRFWDTLKSDTG